MALDNLDESRVLLQYLVYALKVHGLLKAISGTAQPQITRESLKSVSIPLPPLPEQKRIAAILDEAEALRAKRRKALALLDELTQSIFLDMFGDLHFDGISCVTVADLVNEAKGGIRTGPFGSQLLHSEFTDSGVAVLGIDNAVQNEFAWKERRFISESKYRQLKRYTVYPGDVIITIMGTCGRCAIVPQSTPTAINTKHLCCISLDRKKCLPEFLHAYFLRHPVAQTFLRDRAKGAIMSGLNMGIIKEMPVPLYPLAAQEKFANRIESINDERNLFLNSDNQLATLFASLQHRGFRGEL